MKPIFTVLTAAGLLAVPGVTLAQFQNVTQATGPFATLQEAHEAAIGGDVIEVTADHTLTTDAILSFGPGDIAAVISKNITIRGANPNIRLTAGAAYNFGAAILIDGGSTATIEDLVLDGDGFGIGMLRSNGASMTATGLTVENAANGIELFNPGPEVSMNTISGCTLTGAVAGIRVLDSSDGAGALVDSGTVIQNGSNNGVELAPTAANTMITLDGVLIDNHPGNGIGINGTNNTIVIQNQSMISNCGTFGVVIEGTAAGNNITMEETTLYNNGVYHLLIGNGGGAEGDLVLNKVTFFADSTATAPSPIGGFDAMNVDMDYVIIANWPGGSTGMNMCCGFVGTVDNSIMVNDDLITASVGDLTPTLVLTTTFFPDIFTYQAGNPRSVFFNVASGDPDFLTINQDVKDGDPTIAAAHLIDGIDNAGSMPPGGFVGGLTAVEDWTQFD